MKMLSFLSLSLFALPFLAHAESTKISPEQLADAYQLICVPGVLEAKTPADKLAEFQQQRAGILEFFANPVATLQPLEKLATDESASTKDRLGAALGLAIYCAVAEGMQPLMAAQGCSDSGGGSYTGEAAVKACADIGSRHAK